MQAVGAGLGGLGGLFANQTEGSRDAGNVYAQTPEETKKIRGIAQGFLDPKNPYEQAQSQMASNPYQANLFGGTMNRTMDEEQRLANQGFELTPEDRTAYGQASGDIAREYGQSEQSLAQALANRGLSNSGAAGAAFTGLQGNKLEQLAKAQQNIAQQRFQSNLQRLGQTRQFLGQLGNEYGQQYQQTAGLHNQMNNQNQEQAMNWLEHQQDQSNQNLGQQTSTAHGGTMSNVMTGALSGLAAMGGSGGKKSTGMLGA